MAEKQKDKRHDAEVRASPAAARQEAEAVSRRR